MSVSLDGFVARSDGVIEWLTPRHGGALDHGDPGIEPATLGSRVG
jgi:hypothetical protein